MLRALESTGIFTQTSQSIRQHPGERMSAPESRRRELGVDSINQRS